MATPLGNFVRQLREEQNLSVEELALKTGLTMATITNVETGKTHRPNVSTLRVLSDALGVMVPTLVEKIRIAAHRKKCPCCKGEGYVPENFGPKALHALAGTVPLDQDGTVRDLFTGGTIRNTGA